jgi:hypothetical protein
MGQPIPLQHPELVTLAVARAKEGDTNALSKVAASSSGARSGQSRCFDGG